MSGNPLLGDRFSDNTSTDTSRMTIKGTINRLAMLLAITVVTAAWTWQRFTVNPAKPCCGQLGVRLRAG